MRPSIQRSSAMGSAATRLISATFAIAALSLAGSSASLHAQRASDQLVYSFVDDAGSSEALYLSADGRMTFRRNQGSSNDDRGDSTFYLRETWLSSAITSVSMDSSEDIIDDIIINVRTQPVAVSRQRIVGGQSYQSQQTDEQLLFPKIEAATANRVFSQLQSLARK